MKKKLAALLLSFAMVFSLTGCLGNFYDSVMTVEGTDIWPGLYLMMQLKAYSSAEALAEDEDKDVLKQKVEGQNATSWIRAETEELLRRYVAVQTLSEQYGVKLSEESWSYLESTLSYWEYSAAYYERNGVGYDTWRYSMENTYMDDELFYTLYAGDGELAHSREDMEAAYAELYSHIRYLSIPVTTLADSEAGTESEDKTDEVMVHVNALQKRLENGESFEAIVLDLQEIYDLLGRDFDIETAEEYIYASYLSYDSEYYDEEFLDELKTASVGDTGAYNSGGTSVMLYQVLDTFESDEDWEERETYVIESLYRDEYEAWLKDVYDSYSVSSSALAKWYYRPGKID